MPKNLAARLYLATLVAGAASTLACSKGSTEPAGSTALQAPSPVTSASEPRAQGDREVSGGTAPTDPIARADSDMKAVLDELTALGGEPIETLTPDGARRQPTPADAVKTLLQKEDRSTAPEPVGKIENRTFPGPGGPVPVRIYTPKAGKGPFPVVLYFHGGGFVIGTIDTYDATPRALANGADAVVVAVEYRKAPEHRFPAAVDDAIASYRWVLKNAASFAGDAAKVAVAGESAGGNLAAEVSIAARDQHLALPVHELLVYPVASTNFDSTSYLENENAKPLDKAMMLWFTNNYFRGPADGDDPRVNLLNADLKGLPPTTLINAEIDPLRSDGELLAGKLREAGNSVEQKTYSGVTHEFFGMGAVVNKAKDAEEFASARLKKAF